MPNENGTQTMEPDEKPTINLADDKAGSPSKERADKPSTSPVKKVLVISAVIVVAIVAAYFAWNASRYEDTDDAQIDGHIMPLSARINGQVLKVNFVESQRH
jgi:membrane fusion protein (multidrug efflux system)